MRVRTEDGTSVDLDDQDEIGSGGEARVFEAPDDFGDAISVGLGWGMKIFHAPEDAFKDEEEQARRRRLDRKEEKIARFPDDVRSEMDRVIAPRSQLWDEQGRFRGYCMYIVYGRDLRLLAKKSWRQKADLSNEDVQEIFDEIRQTVSSLHDRDVVVGDLNDTNILIRQNSYEPFLIDTDSFQYRGFPCTVGHNRYLDPRLYGEDLEDGPVFSESSDWYSWTVLLFESLMYVHPYGGTHSEHQTLLRRAEAGHSVFQDDVRYPSSARSREALPAGAVSYFRDIFDEGERSAPPDGLLEIDWTTCSTCGEEHARKRCPSCETAEPIPTKTVSGRLELQQILDTDGGIIVHADGRSCVYWKDGMYRREDGSPVIEGDRSPDFRFRVAGRSTWVGRSHVDKSAKIEDGNIIGDQVRCDQYNLNPCFDTDGRHLIWLEEGWIHHEEAGRVGKRTKNRTVFWSGSSYALGFSSIGKMTEWFGFYPGRSGISQIDLPSIEGKILDVRAVFDDESAMVSVVSENRGVKQGMLAIIDSDEVEGLLSGPVEDHRILGETRSVAFKNGKGLVLTEDGLVTVAPDGLGTIQEEKVFERAIDLIAPGCRLFATDDPGELIVAGSQKLHRLSM